MKYFLFIIVLGASGTIATIDNLDISKKAYLQASIYDDLGEEVWSLESPQLIKIVDKQPQIILGQDIPVYESYLKFVRAKKTYYLD